MSAPAAVAKIGAAAIECQVLTAQIHHGRDDPTSQPDASTASFELVGPLPAEAVIGARVTIEAVLGGTHYQRFAGEITDLGLGWDSVDIARPSIIATGDLARLGRRPVGDTPWGQELDGARVSRILTLAGFAPDPLLSDPGIVQVLARDVDRQPALDLVAATASDGGGIVWQDRAGRIRYADAAHRRGTQPGLEVRSCDIGMGAEWAVSLEGLANDVYIRWGPTPPGGEQAEVHASDAASIAARGTYGASLSTQIATALDAQKRADLVVGRQAVPSWVFGGVEVNLAVLDDAHAAQLLALDVHDLLSVTGLPTTSPTTSAYLWVEGWRETIDGTEDGTAWVVAFATSDYCRTTPPPRWDDLPSSLTWNAVDPARTWNRSTCIPPAPSRGRWNDAPASIRWDTADPALTWDTWPY